MTGCLVTLDMTRFEKAQTPEAIDARKTERENAQMRKASEAGPLAGPLYKYQTRRSKIEMQAFLLYSLIGLFRAVAFGI